MFDLVNGDISATNSIKVSYIAFTVEWRSTSPNPFVLIIKVYTAKLKLAHSFNLPELVSALDKILYKAHGKAAMARHARLIRVISPASSSEFVLTGNVKVTTVDLN